MSDCFCTKTYQCLACEKAEKAYAPKPVRKVVITPHKVAQCGTRAGYNRHRRLGEPTCVECRKAQTNAVLRWNKQHPLRAEATRKRAVAKQK